MLPSLYEAWGVVVHEAALAGMPIITTQETGASSEFVIDNYTFEIGGKNKTRKQSRVTVSTLENKSRVTRRRPLVTPEVKSRSRSIILTLTLSVTTVMVLLLVFCTLLLRLFPVLSVGMFKEILLGLVVAASSNLN